MNKLEFYIQLFAEGEEAVTTSTEQETEVNNEETTEEENVEFTDASESNDTNDSKVDNAETQEAQAKAKADQERKAQNKKYAEQRLREKQERERKKIERDAYIRGLKASTKGINPYTNKPIEDEFDVQEYETMMELEKQGKDPIDDYQDYVKQQQRKSKQEEEQRAKLEEEKKNTDINNVQEFVNKYGFDFAQKLNKDKDWIEFSNKLLGKASLTEVYEAYQYIQKKAETKTQKALEKERAKSAVQTGGHSNVSTATKSFTAMSDEEFRAYSRKIRGLD